LAGFPAHWRGEKRGRERRKGEKRTTKTIMLEIGEKGERIDNLTAGNGRGTPEAPNTANERIKIIT
jgi:hypothetical protein